MKTFLVINTSFFGDTILTNPLCQNIKLEYPDAKVVFMVNKPFYEVAKYMKGVDEVICYDKKGKHKGLSGFLNFYHEYKEQYKNKIDASFVIYGNERGIILSKLLGAKKIYSDNTGLIKVLLDNGKIDYAGREHTQDKNGAMLELYTGKKVAPIPMHYTPPKEAADFVDEFLKKLNITEKDDLVAVCTTTKRVEKDMKIDQCVKLMAGLKQMGKTVLFVGSGQVAIDYVKELNMCGCREFIDLTNKTTIAQLGEVMTRCSSVVSVDTGTMHFSLALGVPVVSIFYLNDELNLRGWAPKNFYVHRLMADGDWSAEKMLENVCSLDEERVKNG